MIELTNEFKNRVVAALAVARENYDGSDAAFAKKIGISSSIYNRVKSGVIDKIMRPEQCIYLAHLKIASTWMQANVKPKSHLLVHWQSVSV